MFSIGAGWACGGGPDHAGADPPTTQLRADEASAIIEPQLAGALSRPRWVLERLLIPIVGTAILLALGGWLIGAGYGATIGDSSQGMRIAGAALAYWPAVMALVGLALLLFGYVPRVAIPVTWGILAAMWIVMLIGDALHLPAWALNLLPFSATPNLPAEPMRWTPLIVMTAVAVMLARPGRVRRGTASSDRRGGARRTARVGAGAGGPRTHSADPLGAGH